ncbi:MAG: hypothetical protein QOH14_1575 [Pseudonocardiales bacterium]|nr:hypothetical protein [Pseudonocardiales bacterium]
MKTYQELLAGFDEARARADAARDEWDKHLPSKGIRLTSHPALREAHDAILAAEVGEAAAREALISYRGE